MLMDGKYWRRTARRDIFISSASPSVPPRFCPAGPPAMLDRQLRCSRRKFRASAAALTLGAGVVSGRDVQPSRPGLPSTQGRKPLAVVTTVYRPLSHAFHIAGRFLHGYALAGKHHVPKHYVHSLFVAQKQ